MATDSEKELASSLEDGKNTTTPAKNSGNHSEIEEIQPKIRTFDIDVNMSNADHQNEESKTLETINPHNEDDNTETCQTSDDEMQDQQHFNLKEAVLSKENCDACKEENSVVVDVCTTCEDRLCAICSKSHGVEASKDVHNILSIGQVLDENFPCVLCGRNVSQHCQSCNSDFCDKCKFNHLSDEVHEHTMIDRTTHALTFMNTENPVCRMCNKADIMQTNIVCQTCDSSISLCEKCPEQHKNAFTDHEICSKCPKIDKEINLYEKDSKSVQCIPCQHEHIKKNATSLYQICAEPEPMCAECAAQHIRERRTPDHEICKDIHKLLSTDQLKADIVCENCSFVDIVSTAVGFCMTCDEQDPLCEKCANFHLKLKSFRNHEMCFNLDRLKNEMLCEPCSVDNERIPATQFCVDCEEPEAMCQSCANMHLKQRSGRGHKFCEDIGKFPKSKVKTNREDNEQHTILCHPYSCDNPRNVTTHFGNICKNPEPLCQICAKQHILQRSERGHSLCEDLGEFTNRQNITLLINVNKDNTKNSDDKRPENPNASNIKSDFIQLFWTKTSGNVDNYQIQYRNRNGKGNWKFVTTDSNENHVTISGLTANTSNSFRFREILDDQEGCYGPVNDTTTTLESLATTMLGFCELKEKGSPSKYQLPVEENLSARNKSARTRQLLIGRPMPDNGDEKTILLVGATGSGKSTLVDGIVNYVMGVSFEDPFRFTLVTLEEEKRKTHNQAVSQTEWITVYKIAPQVGSRLKYTLNIIDTPGFGDTRGIERDHAVIDQIRHLFSAQGEKGVFYINAVCFIAKAPDARLTVVQKYIFDSIMSLFGKDIESNICTLITFADGAEPPVLASLKESKLPFGATFQFNNSALFSENKTLANTTLSPMFWEMDCCSFERFFERLDYFQTKSLCQTKNVLDEREQLKTVISNIRPQVTAGLSKLSELQEELAIFTRYKNEIRDNENFTYEVDETKQNKIDLPPGQHVTNCLQCNITCHENCQIANDDKKGHVGQWIRRDTAEFVRDIVYGQSIRTPHIFSRM